MAVPGRAGDGWYGPSIPDDVTVSGHKIANTAKVVFMLLADLGADVDWSFGSCMDRRLTSEFAGREGVKIGDTVSWEDRQHVNRGMGTEIEDANKTTFDRDRFNVRIKYNHHAWWELNVQQEVLHVSAQTIRENQRSAIDDLAADMIMNVTRHAVGNYVYPNVSGTGGSRRLNNPGAVEEATLVAVRDGAKVFTDMMKGMRLRGVVTGTRGSGFKGFLNLDHGQSLALETMGVYHPGGVAERLFREPTASGKWYGSNLMEKVYLADQQIGSLNGTGAIQLNAALNDGSTAAQLKGFGASQSAVLYAYNTIGFKNRLAVDPRIKTKVIQEVAQMVITPAVENVSGGGTPDYGAYSKDDLTYDSDSSAIVTVNFPRGWYWDRTQAATRHKVNVNSQPAANDNVILDGVEMDSQAARALLAGKTLTMSHFYLEKAIKCPVAPLGRLAAGVSQVALTSGPRRISTALSEWATGKTRTNTTRIDLGMYGLALNRPDSACRLAGATTN